MKEIIKKIKEILKKQAKTKRYYKAFIQTNIGIFHGFSITQLDENYIYGIPTEETSKLMSNKTDVVFWRIPLYSIIDISFIDYSEIKL